MRIRTKIYFVALFPVFVVLVAGTVMIFTFGRLRDVAERSRMISRAARGTFDLNLLMSDFLMHGNERTRAQWLSRHGMLVDDLDAIRAPDIADGNVLRSIRTRNQEVKGLFVELVRTREKARTGELDKALARAWEERLVGQLLAKLQAMVSGAHHLDTNARESLVEIQEWTRMVLTISVVLVAAGMTVLSVRLGRSIVHPLRDLRTGTHAIGEGDLDHKVGTDAGDEIGELSRSFDEMTDRLKTITASRDELDREIRARRLVEATLKSTLADLERSNGDLEQFAYIASHDLQEPLRTVASFSGLLEKRYKGQMDDDADEFIDFITGAAGRAQRLINDLLQFSRVGTRGNPFVETDVGKLLDDVVAGLTIAIEESGAKVTHGDLPSVVADEVQLGQVLQNLIGNAIKFCPEGAAPEIHVDAADEGGEWVFSVRDNGIGIEPQYFERIFKIFQRLHGVHFEGTGLGLAICRKIVERHGGTMWLESEPGAWTCFYFSVPKRHVASSP